MCVDLSGFTEFHIDDDSWALNAIKTRLVSFYTPVIHIEVALHRRCNRWYIVYSRAYGMADGWELFAPLNQPQPSNSSTALPKQDLHHRFWLRERPNTALEDLLAATPPILKATSTTRIMVKVENKENEVLLGDGQLSQRHGYCGCWEYSYPGETRYEKATQREDDRIYCCGMSV
ncbi:uncharacterized protein BT62DRAFT_1004755 [Guyanagaster necrorhizus]|uniref:Uncharacterized protein n=1 Tax=Guyanagaster necrorhizus TaxID=856835 RepID=A0A9P7VTG5_9AGAR|nr:uncharacterized protein BT62DRAFT_1004755 [Guyanagaster necrorhizus MCA 3950]KAG7447181.1 hypothetical protein BT62DRAFT_1004755 [Guyanagaster necrorhizus MCA 3950]